MTGGPRPGGWAGIGGWCDPRFAAVRDAFAANFADRGETGAAACLVVGGTVVADLWGGRAGPGPAAPAWRRDTLVNVFSVGKGLIAACAARLAGQGRPDPGAPVAFGHFGAGGSVGFADPDAGVAFGYVTGQMGPRWRNPRNRALIDAVFASL